MLQLIHHIVHICNLSTILYTSATCPPYCTHLQQFCLAQCEPNPPVTIVSFKFTPENIFVVVFLSWFAQALKCPSKSNKSLKKVLEFV